MEKIFCGGETKMRKLLLFFLFCLFWLFPVIAHAAGTVLYFSDITNGPKKGLKDGLGSGAIVTIWGANLGDSQKTSKVYVGGVAAAHVYYWGNADGSAMAGPAKLYESHGMQTISFSIASTAADGTGNIYVVVDGVQSNTLPFTVRAGNIYHVKTTGENSSGNGSWRSPWKTLGFIVNESGSNNPAVGAGDIVYAHDGVQEADGLSVRMSGNSVMLPISLVAYPGAVVTVRGSSGFGFGNYNADVKYWNVAKVVFQSTGSAIQMTLRGRVVANAVTNITNQCPNGQSAGIHGFGTPRDNISGAKVLGNYIHDFGCDSTGKLHHTTYMTNRSGTPVEAWELGWNHLRNNKTVHGLHAYDEGICGDVNGVVKIHDNVVVNQRGVGIGLATATFGGADTCFSMPVEIYNNILIEPGKGPAWPPNDGIWTVGISITGHGNKSQVKIFNNTIYGYGDNTVYSQYRAGNAAFYTGKGATSGRFAGTLEFRNNIIYNTQNFAYLDGDTGTSIAGSNNLYYYGGNSIPSSPPSWDTAPIISDPLFVNPSTGDFHLQANSPAIDKGKDINGVTRDIAGSARPSGKGFDIGAYEYIIDNSKK